MYARKSKKSISTGLILLVASLSIIGLYVAGLGQIRPVYATLPVVLGVDCGLGSAQAVPDPVTGIPVADGSLDTSCSWIGDADGDTVNDPLVSDNLVNFPGVGGGFTVDVRATGLPLQTNGFDITLRYDTKYLDAVLIDQSGLVFGDPASNPLVLAKTIDRATGTVRMAMVLLAASVSGDATFFRVMFDVVGVGTSSLTISDDVMTNPSAIPHKTQHGLFETVSFFDATDSLGWDVSWIFSPSPEVPGSPLTFSATAACPGCGALSYTWDTDGDGVADAGEPTGNPATITAPPPITHRIALTVSDGTNTVVAVRRLPLAVAVQGPDILAVNTAGTWTGYWLGGIPSATGAYRADWRFCPGTGTTANAVCHRPAPVVAAATGQTNTQTLDQPLPSTFGPGAYHFAGIYTNALKITDSTGPVSPQLGASVVVTTTFLVEVTGLPQAYTVTLISSAAKVNTNEQVTFTATVAYAPTYPTTTGFRSTLFDYRFDFGDGSSQTVLAGGLSATATKTYTTGGTFNVKVVAQEASPSAVSKIQETSNTLPQLVNAPVAGPTITAVEVSPVSPTVGKPITFTATVQGGAQPVTVNWDFGDGTTGQGNPVMHSFSVKGPYTAVATAVDADLQSSAPFPVEITISAQPLVATVACSDGTAGKPISCDVSASGGTSPYSDTGTFSRTFDVKGTYTVSFDVTDANGVTATGSDSVIIAPQSLVVNVVCSDGTAGKTITCDVTATGGTSPYSGTGIFTRTFATKGTYTVSFDVTDANGVTATGSDSVAIGPQPLVVTVVCPDSGLSAGKPFACNVSATGGTSPYSGTGTQTVSYAVKGTYTVSFTVTDVNLDSASGIDPVTIAPQPLLVTVACPDAGLIAGTPFNCDVSATGGTSPYQGTGSQSAVFPVKGTYTVSFTVTDANGVTAAGSDSVAISAEQPPVATVACPDAGLTAAKPFTCDVSATGGTSPYTGTGPQSVTFPTKGTYTVTFTIVDANGVSASASDVVTIAPQPLAVVVVCGDGSAGKPISCDVSASGGTSPYSGTGTFERTFATKGTFEVSFTVTDANGQSATGTDSVVIAPQPLVATVACPDSGLTAGTPFTCDVSATGGTTPYAGTGAQSVVFAVKGTFTVSFAVTDANGVSSTGSDTVVIAPEQPLAATVACPDAGLTAGKPFTCDVSATGGTSPYQGTGPQSAVFPAKGTYTVSFTVSDANGDTATASDIVVVNPQPLMITGITVTPPSPFVGQEASFMATVAGGTGPYLVAWGFGDNTTGTGNPTTHTYISQNTYTVTATAIDANNATSNTFSTLVVVQEQVIPPTVDFAPTTTLVGTTDFVALISGGAPPYSCSWTFGDGSPAQTGCRTSHNYSTVGSFSATLTVTDGNGSTASQTHMVTVEQGPTVIRGKMSWKHHLNWDTAQNFVAKARNPSSLSATVQLRVEISDANGVNIATIYSPMITLARGATDLAITATWDPPNMAEKYSITGTLIYTHNFGDLDGDLVDEMVIGTDGSKSGSFAVVSP